MFPLKVVVGVICEGVTTVEHVMGGRRVVVECKKTIVMVCVMIIFGDCERMQWLL